MSESIFKTQQTEGQTDTQTYRDRQADTKDRQVEGQTLRQVEGQTGRGTDPQTDRRRDRGQLLRQTMTIKYIVFFFFW